MALVIKCCNGCVPPKRQLGCHDWCKEYLEEKAKYEKDKKKEKESRNAIINRSQFVGNAIHRKRNFKRKEV